MEETRPRFGRRDGSQAGLRSGGHGRNINPNVCSVAGYPGRGAGGGRGKGRNRS